MVDGCFVVERFLHVVVIVMRVLCLYSPGFVKYIFVHFCTVNTEYLRHQN